LHCKLHHHYKVLNTETLPYLQHQQHHHYNKQTYLHTHTQHSQHLPTHSQHQPAMPAEVLWAPVALRLLRAAATKTASAARSKVVAAVRPLIGAAASHATAAPSASFATASRASRPLNDVVRRFFATTASTSASASSFTRHAAQGIRSARRTTFASSHTLRPNLTGGAFPRSAGGYGLGGGSARFFSHGPTAPGEVVQQVSQAMRAFALSGKRARYNGVNGRGGLMYSAVSAIEEEAARKIESVKVSAPGAYIDFRLSPVVTAVNPVLAAAFPCGASDKVDATAPTSLHSGRFLELLGGDFARASREMATVLADLGRLARLGDLPVSMQGVSVLRVRFPGVDGETVERLCDDAGLCRGYVGEDEGFRRDPAVVAALRFPFAPGESDKTAGTTTEGDLFADGGLEMFMDEFAAQPWLSDPEASENGSLSEGDGEMANGISSSSSSSVPWATSSVSLSDSVEGLYRFIEACDRAEDEYVGVPTV